MYINTQAVIKNIRGEAMQTPGKTSDDLEDLTLGRVIVEAVLGTYEDEKLKASEQHDRYLLAQRFMTTDGLPVQVSRTQADEIKALIAKRWKQILIAGQAVDMIDSSPKDVELKAVN